MKNPIGILSLILSLVFATSCQDKVAYLDSSHPGLHPKLYAVGKVNVAGRLQQNLTMSPDGREHLITITDSEKWRYERILRIKQKGHAIAVDTPRFVTEFEFKNVWFMGEPMISPDNQELYFVADYPPDIWKSKRLENQDWSSPFKWDLSTSKDDWYVSISKKNNVYFTNGSVFQVDVKDGGYGPKVRIDIPHQSEDIRDPCISPNEDYLIFTAARSLANNLSDLFVTFKDGKGNWSTPQNLGEGINTEYIEFAPYISPDGKFLFFSRRDSWENAAFSNIYWVSIEVVEDLRKR